MIGKRFFARAAWGLTIVTGFGAASAQTNPTALPLPVTQTWGTSSFSTMPAGFAAWNGVNGGTTNSVALAENSTPNGDATLWTSEPKDGGTGGVYGYAWSPNARLTILTSSNATNGASQLAMAINTTGQANITLAYDLVNIVANARTIGIVAQYRIGTSGTWTTLSGTGNPYIQNGGTAGTVTPASVTLPSSANNQPVVQIRWASWRGTTGDTNSAAAIDNISVTAGGGAAPSISSVSVSKSAFLVNESGTVTVQLSSSPPPGSPATVALSSGAFASPVNVVIANPAVSASANVTMLDTGSWTATATAVTGCTGSAVSPAFSVGTAQAPLADAGPDRTITLNGEPASTLMTDATADDPNGLDGLTYAWTPATGTGIAGWTARTGQVLETISPADAEVTFTTTGTYVLTLTVTDPSGLTASDSVTITVIAAPPTGEYDPPTSYYNPARPGGVWLTGASLKSALNGIINGHTQRSYDAAKQALQILDRDPNNASNVILAYTGASVSKTWNGTTWNREHLWPDSLNGSGAPDSDLFNLRACNPNVNSTRGNDPYGIGSGYWDPDRGAPDRGRCSRAMFYMATRYTNLTLVNGQPGNLQMGDLAKMLEWHYTYPPDNWERRRNHFIYSSTDNPAYYQGNRNPFIDHPELVWTVYGSGPSNAMLYLGSTPPPGGTSSTTMTFQVIKGAALPSQTLTLNKTGSHPTTYDVRVSGTATTPQAGTGQTFAGGSSSRSITVSIDSTATVGNKVGSVIIDNTEVSSAGAGQGAQDGNDTITISGSVLERSNATFSASSDQNQLTINFGTVPQGRASAQPFSIRNIEAVTGLTAGLDLDAISGSGATSRLTSTLAAFSNLAAGASASFSAQLDTAAQGTWQATYTLQLSDQDLPGAQGGQTLTLILQGTVGPPLAGDFDLNGYVDGADFAIFLACRSGPQVQYELNTPPPGCTAPMTPQGFVAADFDTDQDVDQDDFGVLQTLYTSPQ